MRRLLALVMALLLTISTTPTQAFSLDAADVDGDGEVSILDATAIQRYLAGFDDSEQMPINSYETLEMNVRYFFEHEEVSVGEDYQIYDTDELTADILEHRTEHDVLIIERIIGQVTNGESFDGRILNTKEPYYNYISYRYAGMPIQEGTVLITYFIYNPNTDGVDDIVNRYDFVLDRRYEDT